jgi:hypothetical protein
MTTQKDIRDDRKRRSRCRQWHPFDAFAPKPHLRSGFDSWCRDCKRAANRAWRDRNRDSYNAQRRAERAAAREARENLIVSEP